MPLRQQEQSRLTWNRIIFLQFVLPGHKGLFGPQGTGGIALADGVCVKPLLSGGSGVHSFERKHPMELPAALEAGTLNGHGIAGLHAALDWIKKDRDRSYP